MCNSEWQSFFHNSSMVNLPLPSSDHYDLWLRLSLDTAQRRRNYFKFLGPWLDHPDFKNQLDTSWIPSSSWGDNISRLSANLRTWNNEVFGNIFKRKKRVLAHLEGTQRVLFHGKNERLQILKEGLWEEYSRILHQEEAYWFQQSRSKWIKLRDRNTCFFHQSTLAKRKFNKIEALMDEDGEWIYDEDKLQSLAVNFYGSLYSSSGIDVVELHTTHGFPIIDMDDWRFLNNNVSLEETRKALFSMRRYKAPGPDGFHSFFFFQVSVGP